LRWIWRPHCSGFVDAMLRLNPWLKLNAGETRPPLELLDTSMVDRAQTVEQAATWFRARVVHVSDCRPHP
jgi:hypothetical protein